VALLKAAVVEDADTAKYAALSSFSPTDLPENYLLTDLAADTDSLKQEALQITYFSQNKIQGNITLSKDKLLFFTIPFDKGWKIFDNGAPLTMQQVNIGFSGVLLSAGIHHIVLQYESAAFRIGIIVSIISLLLTGVLIAWFYKRKRPLAVNRN
jgi:uncharacterized membrane protein YfhO